MQKEHSLVIKALLQSATTCGLTCIFERSRGLLAQVRQGKCDFTLYATVPQCTPF